MPATSLESFHTNRPCHTTQQGTTCRAVPCGHHTSPPTGTVQGRTGWYQFGPDVAKFIVTDDGDWLVDETEDTLTTKTWRLVSSYLHVGTRKHSAIKVACVLCHVRLSFPLELLSRTLSLDLSPSLSLFILYYVSLSLLSLSLSSSSSSSLSLSLCVYLCLSLSVYTVHILYHVHIHIYIYYLSLFLSLSLELLSLSLSFFCFSLLDLSQHLEAEALKQQRLQEQAQAELKREQDRARLARARIDSERERARAARRKQVHACMISQFGCTRLRALCVQVE